MDIFETRLIHYQADFPLYYSILFAAVLCLIFYLGIARTQTDSLEKEQVTLTRHLKEVPSHLRPHRQYPQSLDELLSDYHITYDSENLW